MDAWPAAPPPPPEPPAQDLDPGPARLVIGIVLVAAGVFGLAVAGLAMMGDPARRPRPTGGFEPEPDKPWWGLPLLIAAVVALAIGIALIFVAQTSPRPPRSGR